MDLTPMAVYDGDLTKRKAECVCYVLFCSVLNLMEDAISEEFGL